MHFTSKKNCEFFQGSYAHCLKCKYVQGNLDIVTLNVVKICDLLTISKRLFFNLLHKIIRFSDIMRFSDSFCEDQKCH